LEKWFATEEEIIEGKTTDIYFIRTKECLAGDNLEKTNVWTEVTTGGIPRNGKNLVFLGLQDVLNLLSEANLSVNVYSIKEGTVLPNTDINGVKIPFLVIEGNYGDFAIYETPILGLLCFQSGVGTSALRLRKAAEDRILLSFGIRRMPPTIAPIIDRACYVAGFDGVSCVLSAEKLGIKATGTMPHAFIMIKGGIENALISFDNHIDPEVSRIALADTFNDERVEVLQALNAIGDKLSGVRLDTPSSRKGSFREIIREIKWELKQRNREDIKIFLSGGLTEESILELKDIADGFGIGTYVSNSPTIDFGLDIVERLQADLSIYRVDDYDVVEIKGNPVLLSPGAPRMPWVLQKMVIPPDAVPVNVTVVYDEWKDIPGTFNVIPSQRDVPLPVPGKVFEPEPLTPDPLIYASAEPYPEVKVRSSGMGRLCSFHIAHVDVFPVRFVPATGRLQIATTITYELQYRETGNADMISSKRQQEVFGDEVRSIVVNPQDVERFAPAIGYGRGGSRVPPGYYEYVVISAPPMDTVFERLAEWKTKKGVPATVVQMSWISSNYTGYDLAEKVRNFIIDAYDNWGTIYVLLGGSGDYETSGQNIVPTRKAYYTYAGGPDGDSLPSDLYYLTSSPSKFFN